MSLILFIICITVMMLHCFALLCWSHEPKALSEIVCFHYIERTRVQTVLNLVQILHFVFDVI